MSTEDRLIELAAVDPRRAAAELLGVLSMITDRMDDKDDRLLVAWHLNDLAMRIDPDLRLRCLH